MCKLRLSFIYFILVFDSYFILLFAFYYFTAKLQQQLCTINEILFSWILKIYTIPYFLAFTVPSHMYKRLLKIHD